MTEQELKEFALTVPHTFNEIKYVHDLLPESERHLKILQWISTFSLKTGLGIYDVGREAAYLLESKKQQRQ